MTQSVNESVLKEARAPDADRGRRRRFSLAAFLNRYAIVLPFVVVVAICTALVPNFLGGSNISNVLINASISAVIAYGMTIVIALRGLDLSVGSVQGLTACLSALLIGSVGLTAGVLVGVAAGVLVGLINGIVIAYLRVPSFIATLGMLGIVRGVALLLTGGTSVDGQNDVWSVITTGKVLGIPLPFLIALGFLAIWQTVLYYTPFGRHVCAVGGSMEAAVDSGINVRRVTVLAFVLSGLCAAFGGLMLTSQLGSVTGTVGTGLELQIIAIVVLGGTSLMGGNGNLVGTLIASILLAVIASSLNLLNVPSYYQYLAVGILLITALSLDTVRRRLHRRRLLEA